jgi:hypothetical protein
MAKQEITIDKIGGVLSNINTKVQANTKAIGNTNTKVQANTEAIGNFVRVVYDSNTYTSQTNVITLTNKPALLTPVTVVFKKPDGNLLTQVFTVLYNDFIQGGLVHNTALTYMLDSNKFVINIGDLSNIFYISYFTTDPI